MHKMLAALVCGALLASGCSTPRIDLPITQGQSSLSDYDRIQAKLAPAVADTVTGERLLNARSEPHNWLTYHGAYGGGGTAWQRGGGSAWVTGTYDPKLNLLYWGSSNPSPDFDGSVRPGDNLYTSSVLALNPDDGSIKWHYQFTPHAGWGGWLKGFAIDTFGANGGGAVVVFSMSDR